MFFLARDHIIVHAEKLLAWTESKSSKTADLEENLTLDINGENPFPSIDSTQSAALFKKTACVVFFVIVCFLTAALVSFNIVSSMMGPESAQLKSILKNWDDSRCGKTLGPLDMTDALYNGNLNGCGTPLYLAFFYIFLVFRCTQSTPIQDGTNMPFGSAFKYFMLSLLKLTLYKGMLVLVYWHVDYVKIDDVGSPIAIMFTNVTIPGIVFAGFLVLGPYDFLVASCHKKFC
jgi:hypothetical protein